MKIKLKTVLCIAFTLGLCVPATTFLWMKTSRAAKEDLPEFPKWNENYGPDLINYLEKTFPFRGDWIEYYKTIDGDFLRKFNIFLEKISGGKYLIPRSQNNVIFGKQSWLFYEADHSVEYYRGTNLLTDDQLENYYYKFYNILHTTCEKYNIKYNILIAPNKENVYDNYMPTFSIVNNYKRDQRLADYVRSKNINFNYLLDPLKNSKNIKDVYYKQDTHWNMCGAYIGYQEFMKSVGLTAASCDFIEHGQPMVGGDLAEMVGIKDSYTHYYPQYHGKSSSYVYLADTDESKGIYHTKNDNGDYGKLLIVGDSFRNALSSYAFIDFKEVMITPSTTLNNPNVSKFIHDLKDDPENKYVLVESVERYDFSSYVTANTLAAMILGYL